MKPLRLMLAAASIAMLSVAGRAEENILSANSVMDGCRSMLALRNNQDFFSQGVCAGAVSAILELASGFCLPQGVTGSQAMRVVVAYIDSQPNRLHEQFSHLA